jgi:hypothetical protein
MSWSQCTEYREATSGLEPLTSKRPVARKGVVKSVSIYGMPSRSAVECAAVVLSYCKRRLANEGVVECVVISCVSLYPRTSLNMVVKINFREELQYTTAAKVLPPSSTAALLLPRCSESAADSAIYLQMKG